MQSVCGEIGPGPGRVTQSAYDIWWQRTAGQRSPSALRPCGRATGPYRTCYLHIIEGETGGERNPAGAPAFDYTALRSAFPGAWIVNNSYGRAEGIEAVASGRADLVAFGRPFISTPDLVRCLRRLAF